MRPRTRTLLLVLSLFLLTAARQRAVPHPTAPPHALKPADVFTFSNTNEVTTRHLALDLTVDFAQQRLRGSATLTLHNFGRTNRLVLDAERLSITRVRLDGATEVTPTLGPSTQHGQSLTIPITPETRTVTIDYSTSPDASGLFWNSAAQSFGRQQPYLYSLSQPVGARSWIPIQDTPSMRLTYEATLRVPPGMLALMSAENPQQTNESGVYTFRMARDIPPYLVALAAARLEFHAFDERTGVYAEPELMPAAIEELGYLPEMVDAATAMLGPFPFSRHDLLLMPPTFIAGGMEHPLLNFINPSVATGNHPENLQPSLLIAHELAHSWSGDATTTGSWEDTWLNEGITSYLAVRFLEMLSGPERSEHQFFLDRINLDNFVRTAPPTQTLLHRPMGFTNFPQSNFGTASYIKGELFMQTLEANLGRGRFDALLRTYFTRFAFTWVDDDTFLAFLRDHDVPVTDLRVNEWIYNTGMPSNIAAPTSSAIFRRVEAQVQRFTSGTPFAQIDRTNWGDLELGLFLQLAPFTGRMAEIDAVLNLSFRNLPPLAWLLGGINARYAPIYAGVERVLMRGGTNSSVIALYTALVQRDLDRARALFAVARDRYHPSVRAQVEAVLNANAKRTEAATVLPFSVRHDYWSRTVAA
ncbi:MAG TPA: leukotriene A4 hydrolase C-terminal domain-containing protein [Thermoanaerobaculia bacterium]